MQKTFSSALAIIGALSLQSSAFAQEAPAAEVPATSYWSETFEAPRVFVGAGYSHRTWSFDNSADVKQNMHYETIGIEHLKNDTTFWALRATLAGGKAGDQWYDHEFAIEANVGYTFAYDQLADFSFTPFIGFGHFRDHEPNYGASDYKETFNYVPVGLQANWTATPEFNAGLRAQANWMVSRSLTIDGSKSTLSKKVNWKVELPLTYAFAPSWDVAVVPFWQHDANADFTQNNTTQQWGAICAFGARIELGFHL